MVAQQDGHVSKAMATAAAARGEDAGAVWSSKGLDFAGGLFYLLLVTWLLWVLLVMVTRKEAPPVWTILLALLFFRTANQLLAGFVESDASFLRGVPAKSRSLFVNTAISLLHSSVVGASVVVLLLKEWSSTGLPRMLQHQQLFGGAWHGVRELLCFTTGYFAYDQWDMLRNHLYNPRSPAILLHHAVLLTCFTLALDRGVTLNYLCLTLVCEVHSVFLHQRKVAQLAGFMAGNTTTATFLWSLNWATFALLRLLLHVLITCKLLHDAPSFPPGLELPLALIGMLLLNLLNVSLGSDMLKAFKRDMAGQRPLKKQSD